MGFYEDDRIRRKNAHLKPKLEAHTLLIDSGTLTKVIEVIININIHIEQA